MKTEAVIERLREQIGGRLIRSVARPDFGITFFLAAPEMSAADLLRANVGAARCGVLAPAVIDPETRTPAIRVSLSGLELSRLGRSESTAGTAEALRLSLGAPVEADSLRSGRSGRLTFHFSHPPAMTVRLFGRLATPRLEEPQGEELEELSRILLGRSGARDFYFLMGPGVTSIEVCAPAPDSTRVKAAARELSVRASEERELLLAVLENRPQWLRRVS